MVDRETEGALALIAGKINEADAGACGRTFAPVSGSLEASGGASIYGRGSDAGGRLRTADLVLGT